MRGGEAKERNSCQRITVPPFLALLAVNPTANLMHVLKVEKEDDKVGKDVGKVGQQAAGSTIQCVIGEQAGDCVQNKKGVYGGLSAPATGRTTEGWAQDSCAPEEAETFEVADKSQHAEGHQASNQVG